MSRNEKGLTLIELLASMVILSIFAIGFATMLMNGLKANERNQIVMEATLVAQSEIEGMRLNKAPDFCKKNTSSKDGFTITRSIRAENQLCHVTVKVDYSNLLPEPVLLETELNIPKAVSAR
ncbi:type IV pilus modification PilV family protein [Alkalicoccobacillus gibsonii]|uniref:type IV pilus modification PilV family protein n=1 Tax=Alkalicoccobacillus gibsonii TaxID=79881 RepID=UPI0019346BF4|nr:type II secretion system protein [Alkalicoccobacillus gibsonii]MBM0067217.1 type II secretion system protein [Alkalicoccobacillus gibsonii]